MDTTLLTRLETIAREECFVPQLTARNSDSLDFHDVSCLSLQAAMRRAYEMGLADAERARLEKARTARRARATKAR